MQRRIARWEHEDVLEAVQKPLDKNPQAMRQRRETIEHPFGTLKMRMGATHFLMKRLPKVATEMACKPQRRDCLAGHVRLNSEMSSQSILWDPAEFWP